MVEELKERFVDGRDHAPPNLPSRHMVGR
jgi:hypothetical protein